MFSAPIGYRWYIFWRGNIYLNSQIHKLDMFCRVSRLDIRLQPDHDSAAVVALSLQITATLALILTIQCKGDFTDMLEEKISAGKTEIY